MAVLLIKPPHDVGPLLVGRLVGQSDQVRVIDEADEGEPWRRMGAHLALGDPSDLGLVATAALGCRTIVAFTQAHLIQAAAAAQAAGVERVVAVLESAPPAHERAAWGVDHVILMSPAVKRRWGVKGRGFSPEVLAEAIDAADDIAGHPRLTLDLKEPASWGWLNLNPPE